MNPYRKQVELVERLKAKSAAPKSKIEKVRCPNVIHLLMESLKLFDEDEYWRVSEKYLDMLENDPRSARRAPADYEALEDKLLEILLHHKQHAATGADD